MFFVNVTATTRIYTFRRTLSRPDALPILSQAGVTGNGTLSTEGAVGRLDNTKSPITAEQIREWCATAGTILIRPVIDVAGHEPTGAYEIAARQARTVLPRERNCIDRKRVVEGKSVSVRIDTGGRRILKKQTNNTTNNNHN